MRHPRADRFLLVDDNLTNLQVFFQPLDAEGFDCGAVYFVSKPFQFEEVVARVKKHLENWHRELGLVAQSLIEAGESSAGVTSPTRGDGR